MSYNLRGSKSSSMNISDVENLLSKKLVDLATKDCINELKGLILAQDAKLKKQDEELTSLKQAFIEKEERVKILESQVSIIQNTVSLLKRESDESEQYSRRLCLRISGIKPAAKESANDCLNKVKEVIKSMKVQVPNECIDRAHRIGASYKDKEGKQQQSMIVRFTTWRHRTAVYKGRRNDTKKNYGVRLDLTRERLNLLKAAREFLLEKDPPEIDFVFADVNCRIMAKLSDDSLKGFYSIEELKRLCTA